MRMVHNLQAASGKLDAEVLLFQHKSQGLHLGGRVTQQNGFKSSLHTEQTRFQVSSQVRWAALEARAYNTSMHGPWRFGMMLQADKKDPESAGLGAASAGWMHSACGPAWPGLMFHCTTLLAGRQIELCASSPCKLRALTGT